MDKYVKIDKQRFIKHNMEDISKWCLTLGTCVTRTISLLYTFIQVHTNGILHPASAHSRFFAGWEDALSLSDQPSDQSPLNYFYSITLRGLLLAALVPCCRNRHTLAPAAGMRSFAQRSIFVYYRKELCNTLYCCEYRCFLCFINVYGNFIVQRSKPVSARTSHDNCGTQRQNKTGQLYFRTFYSLLCNVGYCHTCMLSCALK